MTVGIRLGECCAKVYDVICKTDDNTGGNAGGNTGGVAGGTAVGENDRHRICFLNYFSRNNFNLELELSNKLLISKEFSKTVIIIIFN